jgi:hypothetical protein
MNDGRADLVRRNTCRQQIGIVFQQRETFRTRELNRLLWFARQCEQMPQWTGQLVHTLSLLAPFFRFHKRAENVALGDDADQLVSVKDRQRADLVF